MIKKNNNSEIIKTVLSGLSTAWTSYKRTARHRHEDPMTSFWNDLFGIPMNDVDAAKYLAEDVAEIRKKLVVKKTEKAFNKIVKNQL